MRWASLFLTAAVAGCGAGPRHVNRPAAPPPPRATPVSTTTVSSRIPATLFNEATEPDAPVVREKPDCGTIIGGWRFRESSGRVYASKTSDDRVSGMRPPANPHEETRGAWQGDALHLEGRDRTRQDGVWTELPVTYDLRLSASGHLVGTRNGSAIDLAPTVIRGPDCSNAPPVP